MLVAKKKRKENIAEYILYIYQVEDLIRAFRLDMNLIENQLVTNYGVDENTSKEITDWYSNLVIMMDKEGIREQGHLQFLVNLINDVNQIHLKLIETGIDGSYVSTYQAVAGLITELKQKNKEAKNDVDLAITAIYGFLLLKMQKKTISDETTEAIKRISRWLGLLSEMYKKYEDGDLEF
ncbi:DUF4924 family protein [Maribellus comscasis]|uniref:DUF4924 family protein n=1 Tax=Maribellus comscasis TaxID=2681766 RepID=A0A6I6JQ46_9BACT|nr:DUF4924 family protein [Maribellus comscasis]QGY42342.1 DUF4924 family protein [Maribellus comscasis]